MITASHIDVMLSTLNATDVGTLDSVLTKLRAVQQELVTLGEAELGQRAEAAMQALGQGDVAEFRRARAFLQSKIGHLRK